MKTISDAGYACFDYIMNTRRTYDMLGQAVGFLLRFAKRHRMSVEEALHDHPFLGGWSAQVRRRWLSLLQDTVHAAIKDYEKNFAPEMEECPPEWLDGSFHLVACSYLDVMHLALERRDAWKE